MPHWSPRPSSATPKPREPRSRKARLPPRSGRANLRRHGRRTPDARWTLKFAKARLATDGRPQPDIAIPSFGYKSRISICRAFGFIRKGKVTDGARYDGRMLRDIVSEDNVASDVWADTAYRSQSNERWLKSHGWVSRIHRRKPKGRPMPAHIRRGNVARSKVRRCSNRSCRQRIFVERADQVATKHSRRSVRLGEIQRTVGLALGGEAGARLADRIGMPISADTMIRLVRNDRLSVSV